MDCAGPSIQPQHLSPHFTGAVQENEWLVAKCAMLSHLPLLSVYPVWSCALHTLKLIDFRKCQPWMLEPWKRYDFLNCSSETKKTLKHGKFVLFHCFPFTYAYFRPLQSAFELSHPFIWSQKTTVHATDMNNVSKWSRAFTFWKASLFLFWYLSLLLPAAVSSAICSLKHLPFFLFHPMLITVNSQSLLATNSYEHVPETFILLLSSCCVTSSVAMGTGAQ